MDQHVISIATTQWQVPSIPILIYGVTMIAMIAVLVLIRKI